MKTGKKNCNPQKSYNCGRSCIRNSYACRVEFVENISMAISTKRKQSKPAKKEFDYTSELPDKITSFDDLKEATLRWQKDRNLEEDLAKWEKKYPGENAYTYAHDSAHIMLYAVTGLDTIEINKRFGFPERKTAGNSIPSVAEEGLVIAMQQYGGQKRGTLAKSLKNTSLEGIILSQIKGVASMALPYKSAQAEYYRMDTPEQKKVWGARAKEMAKLVTSSIDKRKDSKEILDLLSQVRADNKDLEYFSESEDFASLQGEQRFSAIVSIANVKGDRSNLAAQLHAARKADVI